ncbi:hypothetical protein KR018_009193 [Drosophila ironensis]|nr:hypothetical protein KR018_009193 [Drosophila ironensis]
MASSDCINKCGFCDICKSRQLERYDADANANKSSGSSTPTSFIGDNWTFPSNETIETAPFMGIACYPSGRQNSVRTTTMTYTAATMSGLDGIPISEWDLPRALGSGDLTMIGDSFMWNEYDIQQGTSLLTITEEVDEKENANM